MGLDCWVFGWERRGIKQTTQRLPVVCWRLDAPAPNPIDLHLVHSLLLCVSSHPQATAAAAAAAAATRTGRSSSIIIMPPRLTMRELEAWRRRAREGIGRVQAASERVAMECDRRMRLGGAPSKTLADAAYRRLVNEVVAEIASAVEMIREGLPHTHNQVGFRLLMCLGVLMRVSSI